MPETKVHMDTMKAIKDSMERSGAGQMIKKMIADQIAYEEDKKRSKK